MILGMRPVIGLFKPIVAPVWASEGSLGTLSASSPCSSAVAASDLHGRPLTYSADSNFPSFLTLNPATGFLSGTAPPSSVETTYNFTITATNGHIAAKQSFSISSLPSAPPTWVSPSGSLGIATTGQSFSGTVDATDPSSLPVTYSVTSGSLPLGLSVNASTGLVSGTVSLSSIAQTYTFTITASNGYTSSSQVFTIGEVAVFKWPNQTTNWEAWTVGWSPDTEINAWSNDVLINWNDTNTNWENLI